MKQILIVILSISAFLWIAFTGIARQERSECMRWSYQDKSKLSTWQVAQCEKHNIPLGLTGNK